ncbi:MAG TPA: MarR family transcriptional regulator [Conexibacter sp.]|nr:MarR family transcriptional regulator [Conexibacter sp.]
MHMTPAPDTQHADLDADAVTRLRTVVGRLARRLRSTRAGDGLTPTKRSVLFTVVREGPLRLSELAEREGLNPTMLSRVVAHLAEAGLVHRLPDPSDGRAARVEATTAGHRLRDRIHAERDDALGLPLERLAAAERAQLLAALPLLERLADELRDGSGRA